MIHDELLQLKMVTTTPVSETLAGSVTIVPNNATGLAVIEIDKCPMEGIPIEVIAGAEGGNSTNGTIVVTIEAADTETVDGSYAVVATFPTLLNNSTANKLAKRMVRRIATQKKYLRAVITVTAGNGTISRLMTINVGEGLIDKEP